MIDFVQEVGKRVIGVPKSWASAACTTEWIDVGECNTVDFFVLTGAWAGGTAAVTLSQAINASGSSSAALGLTTYWTNDGAVAGDAMTKTTAASSTFNLDTADALYHVQVRPDSLTAGKSHVRIAIASPGANADFYSVLCLAQTKHKGSTPPTIIT
ncbi:hypothetical protein KKE60_06825 [Patescibacteria group bacterium]|nr:hypothetical protein [Patescibacteria group bacterium]